MYWKLIILIIFLIFIYNLCMSLLNVTVRGQSEILYNSLCKSFNFLFDKVPDLIIDIPNINFNNYRHLLNKIPGIPEIPTNQRVNINQPHCSFSIPDPVGMARCVAQKIYEAVQAALRAATSFLCLHEDTLIIMDNNKLKKIKDIHIGDKVLNNNYEYNTVFDIHKELVNESIVLYGINDMEPFFTKSHPLCTSGNKLLSLDPESSIKECPEKEHLISKLEINSKIYIYNKNSNKLEEIIVNKINHKVYDKSFYVYDLSFEDMENGSYIANNILINSQEPNYLSNPKINCIIGFLAYSNYKNRNNYKINIEDTVSKTYDIEITKEESKMYFNFIISKVKENEYKELGNFANKLWIKYYTILNDSFSNISNRRNNNKYIK